MSDREPTAAERELADVVGSIRAVHEDSEPRGPEGGSHRDRTDNEQKEQEDE